MSSINWTFNSKLNLSKSQIKEFKKQTKNYDDFCVVIGGYKFLEQELNERINQLSNIVFHESGYAGSGIRIRAEIPNDELLHLTKPFSRAIVIDESASNSIIKIIKFGEFLKKTKEWDSNANYNFEEISSIKESAIRDLLWIRHLINYLRNVSNSAYRMLNNAYEINSDDNFEYESWRNPYIAKKFLESIKTYNKMTGGSVENFFPSLFNLGKNLFSGDCIKSS